MIRRAFDLKRDFDRVDDFLSQSFKTFKDHVNWDNGRWAFNRYMVNGLDPYKWAKDVVVWEEAGNIVGLIHPEEVKDYFMQVHPDHLELEEEMIRVILSQKRPVCITSIEHAIQRKNLLVQYGGKKLDFKDKHRYLKLAQVYELGNLSLNYRLLDFSCVKDEAIKKLYKTLWPESPYMDHAIDYRQSKAFKEDLAFALVDTKGACVAFVIFWLDKHNYAAHAYPVASLVGGEALSYLLKYSINILTRRAYELVTISAWYENSLEKIFTEIGFQEASFTEIYKFY